MTLFLIYSFMGLATGNFIYALLCNLVSNKPLHESLWLAFDRSFFQGVALLVVWIFKSNA